MPAALPDALSEAGSHPPLILAVETALAACSCALVRGGEVIAARREDIGRGHAERLMPMTEAVMAEARAAGLDYPAIDALAVTVGPGAFTGLRIGLSAARALGLALGRPVVPVTSFEAVAVESLAAAPLEAGSIIAVLHDARRGELYLECARVTGRDADGLALLDPVGVARALPVDEAVAALDPATVAAIGSGVPLVRAALAARGIAAREDVPYPDAVWVARIAARRLGAPLDPARPLYLRAPDAKLPGGISLE